MLSAVEDGIYVSNLEVTYFSGGKDSREPVLVEKAKWVFEYSLHLT
jgi:hypothetical protein